MKNKLIESINNASNIVFFTGAGISTNSGIPDFRSSNGLYKMNLRAEEMISHSFFVKYPEEFFEFYKSSMIFPDAKPNFGHQFIADLERTKNVTVVTQNIDGLHQLAGSSRVIELHGSIHRNYCTKCHKFYNLNKIKESPDVPCCECGAIIKPDVVLYEEPLDEKVITEAIKAISSADTLIILGTSLNVYPAASFVRFFKGKSLCLINRDETQADRFCDVVIHDSISSTLKSLCL